MVNILIIPHAFSHQPTYLTTTLVAHNPCRTGNTTHTKTPETSHHEPPLPHSPPTTWWAHTSGSHTYTPI